MQTLVQGDSYDQSSLAPENILDSAIYNLDVVIDKAIESVVDDSLKEMFTTSVWQTEQ